MPSIERMILFGSLVAGLPTPRSDADVLVIVDRSAHEQERHRLPDVLKALSPLPCPVDLFVLTQEEFARALQEQAPLVREALAHGIELL